MELNNLKLFRQSLSISNLSTVLYKKDGSNLEMSDHSFRARLFENYEYKEFFDLTKQKIRPDCLVRIEDSFHFIYLFLRIPPEFLTAEDTEFFSIGPFLPLHMNNDSILQIMEENHVPLYLIKEISAFYDTIPVVENVNVLESLVLCLSSGLFHREYHIERLPEYDTVFFNTTPSGDFGHTFQENPGLAYDSIAERYEVEEKMIEAVAAGDYDRAHHMYQIFQTYQILPRADDPIRNQQHLTIILNTLYRKAAQYAGVHPLYVDDLSTKFALLINKTDTLAGLSSLTSEMTHKYCLLVKNHAMKGYSSVTKEIISYIDFHYMEDLSLNFFAGRFNLTKTYLSSLFKNETGSTITDFIHQVRMRKAMTLINSTSLPVTSVASACGYNDINYFIRIFKRTYGLSPKQYRKSILHPSQETA